MAWFSKKPDPISDRSRALSDEIAHLESQIKRLDSQLKRQPPARLRSTAVPHASASAGVDPEGSSSSRPSALANEPIFEEVVQNRLKSSGEPVAEPRHFNELGVRKYDLPAFLARLRNHFRGPSTSNPKLVSYLAAGGIQGLRPLRYEKRIERNRVLVFAAILFFIVLGLFAALVKHSR